MTSMTTQDSKDNAARQRIVSHMNQDHHDSIISFLEHYCKLSSWQAYSGVMSNINLDEMEFICSGKTYRVPLELPMASFREARERAVELDKECRQALGKSEITVKEFLPPTGLFAVEFLVIFLSFTAYSQRWWFGEGQVVERCLGSAFARFSWTIQPWIISLLALHVAEAVYFARNQLRKHSVNARTPLWYKWVATTFVEGQFAFMRFNGLVSRKFEEKAKQKH